MNNEVAVRSYELLTSADLERITSVAMRALAGIFDRAPITGLYRDRLLLLTFAQGGALHYLNGTNGIKDFDVWAFFETGPARPFPHRKRWSTDFGPSRFGRHPDDVGYCGRRLDLMGRSIALFDGDSPQEAVRRWLASGAKSAIALRQKPIYCLLPPRAFGERIN